MKQLSAVEEMLAIHEMFRRLGYQPEELYVAFNERGPRFECHHNGQEFSMDLSPRNMTVSAEDFVAPWMRAVKEWNDGGSMTTEEKAVIYRTALLDVSTLDLVLRLQAKGMYPPVRETPKAQA